MLPKLGVIFDAGTGMFRVRDLIETDTLDIFMSHVHLDHSVGLTFLYDVLFEKEMSRVTVHVARDKIDTIKNHLYNEQLFPVKPNFEIRELSETPIELADGSKISSFPLKHPGGCRGYRIDWPDRSLAYVTDTTAHADAEYIKSITGVSTLLHECNFPDGWEDRAEMTGHSCLTPVAEVAAAANAGQLYLVHVNPLNEGESPLDLNTVSAIYEKPTFVATDQLVIDV
ncbi:MAG: MBL fold metallo-hydrolase [Mariniblastus sp.]